jgi:hypothetical protein
MLVSDNWKQNSQYSSFDEIVSIVSDLGKGALLGILDIKSAFRLLSVHRADFDLLGNVSINKVQPYVHFFPANKKSSK